MSKSVLYGAGGGGRTRTLLPGLDFESSTSANSITPANNIDIITNINVKVNYKIYNKIQYFV